MLEGKELGLALAVLRIVRGWNQKELAKAAGLHNSAISDYERGRFVPELKTLERIVTAMGFSFAALDHTRGLLTYLTSQTETRLGLPAPSPSPAHRPPLAGTTADLGCELEQASADFARALARMTRAAVAMGNRAAPIARPRHAGA